MTRHLLRERTNPALLSIVIPIFNEEASLPFLRQRLTAFLEELPCRAEVLLVNDGSADNSVELLAQWADDDSRIRVLNLARNFGHQAAATAGLDLASGDAVVLMDADLQDPPEVVLSMLEKYRQGYDVVYGRRASRIGETRFKLFTAWLFYRLMRLLVHRDLPADVGDFRLVSRACLDAVRSMRETHRFLRGMIAWVGFPQTEVSYTRDRRVAGKTAYPFHKMLWLAWTAAVSFSPLPLRLSLVLGFSIAGIGMVQAGNALVRSLFGLYVVPGWSSLIIVVCLVGGAILVSIGVLGEYIGRIFESVKERPLYIVASRFGTAGQGGPAPAFLDASVPAQLASLSSSLRPHAAPVDSQPAIRAFHEE